MSERKLIILGTASQVPTHYRNHNGYFVRWDKEGFLFDPGEGIQRQMIYAGISSSKITKIFITHFHGDHCLGLPGIIQRISLDEVNHPVEIYYPASGQKFYENLKAACIFHDTSNTQEHPILSPGIIFKNEKITIEAKNLEHTVDTWGYRIQENKGYTMIPNKLSAAGIKGESVREIKRLGKININGHTTYLEDVSVPKPGQSMAFIMDTRLCPAAYELAKEADLMVCESTYLSSEEKEAEKYYHLTASQAAKIAKTSGVKKLVLTHFSQRYSSIEDFIKEAVTIHSNVIAVKDGDIVKFPELKRVLY